MPSTSSNRPEIQSCAAINVEAKECLGVHEHDESQSRDRNQLRQDMMLNETSYGCGVVPATAVAKTLEWNLAVLCWRDPLVRRMHDKRSLPLRDTKRKYRWSVKRNYGSENRDHDQLRRQHALLRDDKGNVDDLPIKVIRRIIEWEFYRMSMTSPFCRTGLISFRCHYAASKETSLGRSR